MSAIVKSVFQGAKIGKKVEMCKGMAVHRCKGPDGAMVTKNVLGEWEKGRRGEGEKGRRGEWEKGRRGEWEKG